MSDIGQKIIASVRKHAEANPDFVYQPLDDETKQPSDGGSGTCLYVANGKPSCIVGHGLWDAGVIDQTWEGKDANVSVFTHTNAVTKFGVAVTIDEAHWLNQVQSMQDGGEASWSVAVAYADGLVDEDGEPIEEQDED